MIDVIITRTSIFLLLTTLISGLIVIWKIIKEKNGINNIFDINNSIGMKKELKGKDQSNEEV